MRKLIALLTAVMLCACSHGQNMIGPRSEEAWKEWEKEQAELKETWGDTEVYAYVQTILTDLHNINANVVFSEGFSTETDSEELNALKKLKEDMQIGEETSLEEFRTKLENSSLRYAVGGMNDLDGIEEKGDGAYLVTLLYYPNADSMMAVRLTVKSMEDGSFSTELPE